MQVASLKTCIIILLSFSVGLSVALWPKPQEASYGRTTLTLSPFTTSVETNSDSLIVLEGIYRYKTNLFFPYTVGNVGPTLFQVMVNTGPETPLQYPVDESYSLNITMNYQAFITAKTVWGALHGLETLSQLIQYNAVNKIYTISNAPINITDYPRFPWRGLLIDSSRHYLPVSAILTTIDAMSYVKLNTLHWHIIDDQSFPVQSATFPNLTLAAWDPAAIYTPADIKNITEYAYKRGVRVIPEFDMPGHFAGFGVAFPNIVTPNCGSNPPVNPTISQSWDVISGFLQEMSMLFPDNYIHVGGDEVELSCWDADPQIKAWMRSNNIANSTALEQYFEDRLLNEVFPQKLKNKSPVVWEDLFDNGVTFASKQVIIEVWRDTKELANVIKAGYRGILAAGYYLDQQIPNPSNTWYEWEDTWKNFYENDPVTMFIEKIRKEKPELDESLVIGGEACMWGEQVDQTNIFSRIWPRAAATAERLWSKEKGDTVDQALPRLAQFRCTSFVQRGINAGPVEPGYCRPAPVSNNWFQSTTTTNLIV